MTDSALRRTPLRDAHAALGARLVPFAGWEMPVQYKAGVVAEHKAVRTAAGLFDVCHMGELWLTGEHAEAVVDYLVTNDLKSLPEGKAVYTACCNARGTILDDLILYKLRRDRVLVVCNASNRDKISAHFAQAAKDHCTFEDASERTALLAIQGPRAVDALRAAGATDAVTGLKSFQLAESQLAGHDVLFARTGYTGEDGFELFSAWDAAPAIWSALLAAGEAFGIQPAGLGARDTLRLEARLSLYGNEIDETTNPLEAGLGWVVKLDKGDFIGREALVAVKAAGLSRRLVGFEMVGRGIGRHGYPVVAWRDGEKGEPIGVVTSGSPGPTVGKNVGLAYVPVALAELGTRIGVVVRDQVVEAVVVKTPFYKRPA